MSEFGISLLARGNGLPIHLWQGNDCPLRLRFALHERINAIGKQAFACVAAAAAETGQRARLHDLGTGIRRTCP